MTVNLNSEDLKCEELSLTKIKKFLVKPMALKILPCCLKLNADIILSSASFVKVRVGKIRTHHLPPKIVETTFLEVQKLRLFVV